MIKTQNAKSDGAKVEVFQEWDGIVSRFQLVILASLRSKQLLRGAQPRIVPDPLRRRNTSIALEELRLGLIPFNLLEEDETEAPAPVLI